MLWVPKSIFRLSLPWLSSLVPPGISQRFLGQVPFGGAVTRMTFLDRSNSGGGTKLDNHGNTLRMFWGPGVWNMFENISNYENRWNQERFETPCENFKNPQHFHHEKVLFPGSKCFRKCSLPPKTFVVH